MKIKNFFTRSGFVLSFLFGSQNLLADELDDFKNKKVVVPGVNVVKDISLQTNKNVSSFDKDSKKSKENLIPNLSKKDCDIIIKFLKAIEPKKPLWQDVAFVLKDILKEGMLVPASVCLGAVISYLLFSDYAREMILLFNSNDDNKKTIGKGFLVSTAFILLTYAIIKIIDKKFFSQKGEDEVIRNLLYAIREKRDIACSGDYSLEK